MKVLIYGGSFNPIHKGHKKLLEEINRFYFFNEIWILPNSLNKDEIFLSDKERINLIQEDLKTFPHLKIVKDELDFNHPVPTIDTIKKMHQEYPQHTFYFLMGSDQFFKLYEWEEIEKLSQMVTFIVGTRDEYEIAKNTANPYNVIIHNCDIENYSSSKIRKGQLQLVSPQTLQYLQNHLPYLQKVVENHTDSQRFHHSQAVGKMAQELATIHKPSLAKKAFIGGLMHDIFKNKSREEMFKHMKESDDFWVQQHHNTWHQIAGANFLQFNRIISDQDIISAIKKHTTADEIMSTLDKIVFVADKISHDRKDKDVAELRKVCLQNLDEGFTLVLEKCLNQVRKKFGDNDFHNRLKKKWLKK